MTRPTPDKPDLDTDAPESAGRVSSPPAPAVEPETEPQRAGGKGGEPSDGTEQAPSSASDPREEAKSVRPRSAAPRKTTAAEPRKPAAPASEAPRAPLAELGIGAAWLVGLAAVGQMLAILFRSNPMAIVVLHAVIVDLALGRAGVRWDPAADERTGTDTGSAARRVVIGAGAALAVTVLVIGLCAVAGWAKVTVHGPTASLGLGLVRSIATGVRDALLYAGLPLHFIGRAGAPRMAGVVFGALAAGATLALQPAASPANVALAVAVAAATAAFWAHDRAGWAAAGVAGGFPFIAGVVMRGGLFELDWKKGTFAPGFLADGAPAWIGVAGFLAVAAVLVWRSRRPRALPVESRG